MVSNIVSAEVEHEDAEPALNINLTWPFIRSPDPGVYTGFITVALLKVPVPVVVHKMDVAWITDAVAKLKLEPSQTAASLPAFAADCLWIVNVNASLTGEQIDPCEAVNVSMAEPFTISPALGVYTGFSIVLLLKDPVPELVHNSDVYPEAAAYNVAVFLSQMVWSAPALTMAGVPTEIATKSLLD